LSTTALLRRIYFFRSILLRCPFFQISLATRPFTSYLPVLLALLTSVAASGTQAQDRLASMPGYERYRAQTRKMRDVMSSAFAGTIVGAWTEDSKAYVYSKGGKLYRCDVGTKQVSETRETPRNAVRADFGGGFLERGRQATTSMSPDKKHKAQYKDGNVWISAGDGANLTAITTDGGKQRRIFYGTASWVYGEELEQHSAMWWSPDSKKLAYYRFDESKVPDYYVALNNLQVQDTLDAEPYPKAGAPNPIVDLYIYDVETRQNVRMDVRDGKPFTDDVVGHYVYNIRWSPDGALVLFNRTNRLQNVMEFTACDPKTGHCRAIVREAWPTSWAANLPAYTFLKDGQRFILASERSGWRNLYLYDLSGKLLAPLTKNAFDIDQLLRVDEAAGRVYYMSHDGDNPMKLQLHRVGLDGTGDKRLTDPKLSHRVDIAPDSKTFADVAQAHDVPPSTRLVDANGSILTTLAQGDMTALQTAGFAPPELFTYKAGDGKADAFGLLYRPSNFDAGKKYPLLVDVYAGPETPQAEMVRENFFRPQGLTEMGFLVAVFDGRGTTRRGKAFMDAVYGRLGQAEIDDQAAGVKFLRQRPYVDGGRVGVFGTSYGGYASIMCLLRYPDVFQAASASSAVTDWRNYDSIYTERYMGLPQQNKAGYDAGSAMTHAKDLKGKLLLYYGTADNNVHPSNTLQLIAALEEAGKSYELQVGPDQGHSGVNYNRMIEFFMDNLVLKSPANVKSAAANP
jgi:dipeptidyl-peptidase-4